MVDLELNPIDIVWVFTKRPVASANVSFKFSIVEQLTRQQSQSATLAQFSKYYEDERKKEARYRSMSHNGSLLWLISNKQYAM